MHLERHSGQKESSLHNSVLANPSDLARSCLMIWQDNNPKTK